MGDCEVLLQSIQLHHSAHTPLSFGSWVTLAWRERGRKRQASAAWSRSLSSGILNPETGRTVPRGEECELVTLPVGCWDAGLVQADACPVARVPDPDLHDLIGEPFAPGAEGQPMLAAPLGGDPQLAEHHVRRGAGGQEGEPPTTSAPKTATSPAPSGRDQVRGSSLQRSVLRFPPNLTHVRHAAL